MSHETRYRADKRHQNLEVLAQYTFIDMCGSPVLSVHGVLVPNVSTTLRSQLSRGLSEYHNYSRSLDHPMQLRVFGEVRIALYLGCLDEYAQVVSRHYLSTTSNAEK